MGREQELERQLKETRAAKTAIIERIADCMNKPDNQKAVMWNTVAPRIQAAVERKLKDGSWPESNVFRGLVYDGAMEAVLGKEFADLLAKL